MRDADRRRGMAPPRRDIILRQYQSAGDVIVLTRALGDLKRSFPDWRINVDTWAPEVFLHNPHLSPELRPGPDVRVLDATYDGISQSGRLGTHFSDAFRLDLERNLGVRISKSGYTPELCLSDAEKDRRNLSRRFPQLDAPYWLINAGHKSDFPIKHYPRWQEAVDAVRAALPGIRLVQVGRQEHNHRPLSGAGNLLGRTTLRDLILAAYHADGTLSPMSCLWHIAAAFGKPAVCVLGGRESPTFTAYSTGRTLHTIGALDCCLADGCWKSSIGQCSRPGDGVPRCMTLITPRQIAEAVESYYLGGRLRQ